MPTLLNPIDDLTSVSDVTLLKIKTTIRLKKLLQREKRGYLRVLHQRTGVGLTVEEFDTIARGLAACGWCSLKQGRQGGVTVIFNEVFNTVNVPEGDGDEQR